MSYMALSEHLKYKSKDQLEEWFLGGLSEENGPIAEMMSVLLFLAENGDVDSADEWAGLLQEVLVERKEQPLLVDLLIMRSCWRDQGEEFRVVCRNVVSEILHERNAASFITSAGFDDAKIPTGECLRRFKILSSVKKGSLCYEKTWGFGVVKRVDDFYEKVIIDFDRKKEHSMSFAYTGETIKLLDESHILAIKYRNPDEMAALVSKNPGEVVRMAIRSFGCLSPVKLKELLAELISPDSDWKIFWDNARKTLKNDPLIELPAKRADPIRLLEKAKAYDEEWFDALKKECDVEKIIKLVADLQKENMVLDDKASDVIVERLAFVAEGAVGKQRDLAMLAVVMANNFSSNKVIFDFDRVMDNLLCVDAFVAATTNMSSHHIAYVLKYLGAHCPAKLAELLFNCLNQLSFAVFNESVNFLVSAGRGKECADRLQVLILSKQAGPDVLYWLCRNVRLMDEWSVGSVYELLKQTISLIGADSRNCIKIQNNIRALFEQKDWLSEASGFLNDDERANIVRIIDASQKWDAVARRSVIAKMISLYPEMAKVMASKEEMDESTAPRLRFTSWRSYRERVEQFRRLIEETIPENSKEIGVARSYGDLRENFEYQTAKDRQRLLLQKQTELEQDLKDVKGTDFSGLLADKAGIGTCVTVVRPSGKKSRYCVLGEWDHDKDLGIISSGSRLACLLEGKVVGDKVEFPGEKDSEVCTIVEITGLTDLEKEWIDG